MKIVVFGGRDFADRDRLWRRLDAIHTAFGVEAVIEGGATGADRLGREWALERGLPVQTFEAAWDDIDRPGAVVRRNRAGKLYDAAAGGVRNQRMLDEGRPDLGVACPGGSGTRDMTGRCHRAGLLLIDL